MPDPRDPVVVAFWSSCRLLECKGCEAITLQQSNWCSEDDPSTRRPAVFYPPRLSRRKPAWMDRADVPREYSDLLDEVYLASHADSRRLAAMGARALIDVFIQRHVGDQGTFVGGLKELISRGFLSERQCELLEPAVDAGGASAHRGYQPSPDAISTVIDIVENLIQNELLAGPAAALKTATPPRPPRNQAKSRNGQ